MQTPFSEDEDSGSSASFCERGMPGHATSCQGPRAWPKEDQDV